MTDKTELPCQQETVIDHKSSFWRLLEPDFCEQKWPAMMLAWSVGANQLHTARHARLKLIKATLTGFQGKATDLQGLGVGSGSLHLAGLQAADLLQGSLQIALQAHQLLAASGLVLGSISQTLLQLLYLDLMCLPNST